MAVGAWVYKSEAVLYSDGAGSSGGCRHHNVAPLCARAIRHVVYSGYCVCTHTEINLAKTVRTRRCLGERCLKPPVNTIDAFRESVRLFTLLLDMNGGVVNLQIYLN